MPRIVYLMARMGALFALSIVLVGCRTTSASGEKTAMASPQKQTAVAEEPAAKDDGDAEKKAKEKAKEKKKNERKLARLELQLGVARLKLDKARLAMEHSEIKGHNAVAKADAELDLTARKFADFTENSAPMRLERSEYDLRRRRDTFVESQEELAQLEMMYAQEDFADKTKEIVLERGRRRLQRSQENLAMTERSLDVLRRVTIPIETREHELRVEEKERSLGDKHRDLEPTRIATQIALMNAEAEIAKLEGEIEDLIEEMEEAEKEKEEETEAKEATP